MYIFVKQLLDYVVSAIMTIVFSPILLIIAIIIKLDSRGPVFFKQKRVGKDEALFDIYKFRTMRTDTPKDMPTHLFNNPEAFITKSGRVLRKTSLDELPQLFNILRGQMSFVGPRPALWNQYDLIAARKGSAARLKPGITGWAQVNGRDELPIDVKAAYDQTYAEKMGFLLDVKILFMTVFSVLTSKGVAEGASAKQSDEESAKK